MTHLDPSGLARVVEHGARLAEDQDKLSTRFSEIADVIKIDVCGAAVGRMNGLSVLQFCTSEPAIGENG